MLALECGTDKIDYVKFANMVGLIVSEDDLKKEQTRANTVYKNRTMLNAQANRQGPGNQNVSQVAQGLDWKNKFFRDYIRALRSRNIHVN